MATSKQTKDFTLWGVKFKDIQISNYGSSEKLYYVNTVGTAQMVRQYVYAKYAKYSKGLKVNSDKFSGGSSIDVYFNRLPEDVYKIIKQELELKFDFHESDPMSDYYSNKTNTIKSSEGIEIEYGGTYFHVKNTPKFGSKEYDEPAPNWGSSTPSTASSGSGRRNYPAQLDKGQLINKFKEGWELYAKTVNGKLVYNIYPTKELKRISKENFDAFKGEVLIETEFKWNPRFQSLEKWVGRASDTYRIDFSVNKLEKIITKYYSTSQQEEQQQESNVIKIVDLLKQSDINIWELNKISSGSDLYNNEELQKKYSLSWKEELLKPIYSQITLTPDEWLEVKKGLEQDNYHALNNLLGLWGLYGIDNVMNYTDLYNRTANQGFKYYLNPKFFINTTPKPNVETPTTSQSKESVEKAIKALQVLAKMGDEKAIKAIKALKYLI